MSTDVQSTDHISYYTDTGKELAVTGFVCTDPVKTTNGKRFYFQLDSIYITRHLCFPVNGKIVVRIGSQINTEPAYGDGLKIFGVISKPPVERNPGEFNYADYLKHRGVYGILSVRHPDYIEQTNRWSGNILYARYVLPVKRFISDHFQRVHSPVASAITSALILGDRSEIPEEIYQAFSQSGTVHVLALSGLHVGFIMALIWGLFGLIRIPFRYRVVLTILGLWYYVALAGFAPSVVRAVIMASVVLIGELIQRRRMLINNLLIAMIVILFTEPNSLFDVGFQLSFTAVISIVWIYPKIETWLKQVGIINEKGNRLLNKALALFIVSVAAQIGTLPFTAYYFYRIPLLATVANMMMIGFISAGTASLSLTISQWYANLNEWVIALMTAIPKWAVHLPLAYTDFYQMSFVLLIGYYCILIWLSLWKYRPIRMAGIYLVLIALNVMIWKDVIFHERDLTITFLDVGQGDCAVVKTPDEQIIIIDAGDRNETYDYGEMVVAPYLRKQGISRIHYLIMTHPHDDHIGGVNYLSRHFIIDTAYHNGHKIKSEIYDRIFSSFTEKSIPHRSLNAGDMIRTKDSVYLFVVSPGQNFIKDTSYSNINDGSLVIGMRYGKKQILWMGDSERNMFGHFNKYSYFMKSDLMKVSHHGAMNGTSSQLIAQVQPKTAIISVGKYNRFNHPSPWVINAYRTAETEVIRTDENGAIIFQTDGLNLRRIK
jgi:competence protein ComEC